MPAIAATAALTVVAASGVPASGAAQLKPRAGQYAGLIARDSTRPIYFQVTGHKVTSFIGTALEKSSCSTGGLPIPGGPAKVSKSGRFHLSGTGVRHTTITIKGHFTSRTTAKGQLIVTVKHKKGCGLTQKFTATRDSNPGG